jgi:hypothetical protein
MGTSIRCTATSSRKSAIDPAAVDASITSVNMSHILLLTRCGQGRLAHNYP